MKKIFLFTLLVTFLLSPTPTNAIELPCSLILEPIDKNLTNSKGVAIIYKVKLTPSFPRTNISILAAHLPKPDSLGDYNTYEGFAFIPNEISWRFKLYPSKDIDGPWAGAIDDITAEMKNVNVQVRLSNSKNNKLGPAILTNAINKCKP